MFCKSFHQILFVYIHCNSQLISLQLLHCLWMCWFVRIGGALQPKSELWAEVLRRMRVFRTSVNVIFLSHTQFHFAVAPCRVLHKNSLYSFYSVEDHHVTLTHFHLHYLLKYTLRLIHYPLLLPFTLSQQQMEVYNQ